MRWTWIDWYFVRFWAAVLIVALIANALPLGK